MNSRLITISLLFLFLLINNSSLYAQKDDKKGKKTGQENKNKKEQEKINAQQNSDSEILKRIDQLTLKLDSISAFIRSTQTAATELDSKKKELKAREEEISRLRMESEEIENKSKQEILQLKSQNSDLIKEKTNLEKRVITADFYKLLLKNNAVLDDITMEKLLSSVVDQSTLDELKEFQNNAKIISSANTFLRDGSNKSSYASIYENIKNLKVNTNKFPEQAKEAEEIKFKILYFDSYIKNVNNLIVGLKAVTDKDSREDEIERSDSFQKIKSLKWLADLCNANMQKHVDLGIKF